MRRPVLVTVALVGFVMGVTSAGWRTVSNYLQRPIPLSAPVVVEIPRGATFALVTILLDDAGVIARPEIFKLYARYRKLREQVKAGRYVFAPPVSPEGVLAQLVEGAPPPERRVTLPEGSNRWQMAKRLADAGVCPEDGFLEASRNLEGQLFPDTYRFRPNSPPSKVVGLLNARFKEVFGELLEAHGAQDAELKRSLGLAEQQLVVLASLVEEEAQVPEERSRIARVFFNRLQRGMRLETDPTCVFGPETWQEVPSPQRCRDPANAYSTYVIEGLPPGPISSPGRASLKAAMVPSSRAGDEKLLYFVAMRDGSGRHSFSETYERHRRAVNHYLKGVGGPPP